MVQQKLREHSPGCEQAKLLRGMAGANVGPNHCDCDRNGALKDPIQPLSPE